MEFLSITSKPLQTWVERANNYGGSRITRDTIAMLERDMQALDNEIGSNQPSDDQATGRVMLRLYLAQVIEATSRRCRC